MHTYQLKKKKKTPAYSSKYLSIKRNISALIAIFFFFLISSNNFFYCDSFYMHYTNRMSSVVNNLEPTGVLQV